MTISKQVSSPHLLTLRKTLGSFSFYFSRLATKPRGDISVCSHKSRIKSLATRNMVTKIISIDITNQNELHILMINQHFLHFSSKMCVHETTKKFSSSLQFSYSPVIFKQDIICSVVMGIPSQAYGALSSALAQNEFNNPIFLGTQKKKITKNQSLKTLKHIHSHFKK